MQQDRRLPPARSHQAEGASYRGETGSNQGPDGGHPRLMRLVSRAGCSAETPAGYSRLNIQQLTLWVAFGIFISWIWVFFPLSPIWPYLLLGRGGGASQGPAVAGKVPKDQLYSNSSTWSPYDNFYGSLRRRNKTQLNHNVIRNRLKGIL